MVKISELSKMSLTKEFGFKESELLGIEDFMNDQNQKTTKDVLDALIENEKLNNKQKIVISYVIGNSARESAIREEKQKGITINISDKIPPFGG